MGIFGVNTHAYRHAVYTVCARIHIGIPDVFNKKNQPSVLNKTSKPWAKDYKAALNNLCFLRELKLNRESKTNETNEIVFSAPQSTCEPIFEII